MKEEPKYWTEGQDEEETRYLILGETTNWWITEKGMVGKPTVHDTDGYEIERHRVGDPMWIAHMADKCAVDGREFAEALYLARKIYGVGSQARTEKAVIPLLFLREKLEDAPEIGSRERLRRVIYDPVPTPSAIILVDPESAERVRVVHGQRSFATTEIDADALIKESRVGVPPVTSDDTFKVEYHLMWDRPLSRAEQIAVSKRLRELSGKSE